MNCLERGRPEPLMYFLIFCFFLGLPHISSWVAIYFIEELNAKPSYRLTWVVVASEVLPAGTHLTNDQVALRLKYEKDDTSTTTHTIASVINRYTQMKIEKDKSFTPDSLGPSPKLEAKTSTMIIPIPVDIEYAGGLHPEMKLRFEKTVDKQTFSLNGTLKAIVPPQAKNPAVLYIEASNIDNNTLRGFASGHPIILPTCTPPAVHIPRQLAWKLTYTETEHSVPLAPGTTCETYPTK